MEENKFRPPRNEMSEENSKPQPSIAHVKFSLGFDVINVVARRLRFLGDGRFVLSRGITSTITAKALIRKGRTELVYM